MGEEGEPEYALTETQKEAFHGVFSMFDKEGLGECSWSEDFPAMFRSVNQNPTQSEIDQIIEDWDKEGTDKFTERTWMRLMDSPYAKDFTKPEEIIEAFRTFDKDGTGTIKIPLMRYIVQSIGDKLEPDAADEFVEYATGVADKEKTGEIDYELLVKALFEKDPGITASL